MRCKHTHLLELQSVKLIGELVEVLHIEELFLLSRGVPAVRTAVWGPAMLTFVCIGFVQLGSGVGQGGSARLVFT